MDVGRNRIPGVNESEAVLFTAGQVALFEQIGWKMALKVFEAERFGGC